MTSVAACIAATVAAWASSNAAARSGSSISTMFFLAAKVLEIALLVEVALVGDKLRQCLPVVRLLAVTQRNVERKCRQV